MCYCLSIGNESGRQTWSNIGTKGLMPNPKTGTVTDNIEDKVKNAKSGQVRFRNDKNGIIHGCIGKVSFDENKLPIIFHSR